MNNTESRLSYLKIRKEIIYIIIGALIPVYPFYVFISYYQSLAPLDCGYFGWWSDCGLFAGIWLVSELIGIILIIKGLLLLGKKTDEEKHPQKSKQSKLKKRSTRSNPLM